MKKILPEIVIEKSFVFSCTPMKSKKENKTWEKNERRKTCCSLLHLIRFSLLLPHSSRPPYNDFCQIRVMRYGLCVNSVPCTVQNPVYVLSKAFGYLLSEILWPNYVGWLKNEKQRHDVYERVFLLPGMIIFFCLHAYYWI